jgi:hypothetical protein
MTNPTRQAIDAGSEPRGFTFSAINRAALPLGTGDRKGVR